MLPLTLLALVLSSPQPLQGVGSTPRIFDRLTAVRSLGTAMCFECDPTGDWLFIAESGSLAVIDANSQVEYNQPRTLLPLGSEGIMPVALALDPAASASNGYGNSREDLLYIAAGREGLWAVEANTASGLSSLDIARIDDSASGQSPLIQNSRRWCDDLGFLSIRVNGVLKTYLLALFARTDNTRLRVYEIGRVRSVIRDQATETGHELLPDINVLIGRHPVYPTFGSDVSRSFGFGMCVDRLDDTQSDVYVAMGEHGLARIRFTSANFSNPQVAFGPVFGTGSPQAVANPLYDDLQFIRNDGSQTVDRITHPIFADVVVQQNSWGHYLYAAVDHLGWVRFDLSNSWSWDPATMPIGHHEGEVLTNAVGEKQVRLAPLPSCTDCNQCPSDPECKHRHRTFARRLSLIDRNGVVVLGVSANPQSMLILPGNRTEGEVLTSDFLGINGVNSSAAAPPAGDGSFTILYRLTSSTNLVNLQINTAVATFQESGGHDVLLIPQQPASDPILEFFGGRSGSDGNLSYDMPLEYPAPDTHDNFTYRSRYDLSTGQELLRLERTQNQRPGIRVHSLGVFRGAPDVVIRGTNDCCALDDGITVLCSGGFETDYDPSWVGSQGPGDDDRGTFGVWFNPDSHWDRGVGGDWYVLGTGNPPTPGTPDEYALTRFHPGTTLCPIGQPDPPQLKGRWYLRPSPDRWGKPGRQYWMSALSETYDQTNDNSWKLLFFTRGGTPDGLIGARRDLIQQFADSPSFPPDEYQFAFIDAQFSSDVFTQWLDTHPEYQNIPLSEIGFLISNGLQGRVQTFFPALFRVAASGTGTPDTWVLGVPCGLLSLPPDLPDLQNNPSWKPPQVYLDNHDHLLVRYWNVQDPNPIFVQPPPPPQPNREAIGPDIRANAVGLDVFEWQGQILGFVTDHGGRILVYDLTSLLTSGGGPQLVHAWDAPLCISDDVPNPIRTVFLDHAQWSYQGQSYEELYVYAGVLRVGIQVLKWNAGTQSLVPVKLIETPGDAAWLQPRTDLTGNRSMLVGDGFGLRLYDYAF